MFKIINISYRKQQLVQAEWVELQAEENHRERIKQRQQVKTKRQNLGGVDSRSVVRARTQSFGLYVNRYVHIRSASTGP